MRITTNTMMRQYNNRLSKVLNNLNAANERVMTGRKFSKAYQDPSSTIQSYRLRREYLKTEDYLNNVEHIDSALESVEGSIMKFSKIAEGAHTSILNAINGTNSIEERKIIAEELRQMQKTLIMDANTQFAGSFVFGGSGNKKPPFEMDANGKVLFRGLDVNDPANYAKLQELSKEAMNVDIGFGLEVGANNKVIDSSVFNMGTPGINLLGFGRTGTPPKDVSKNLVVLLGEIANELEAPSIDATDLERYTNQLESNKSTLVVSMTQIGTKTNFLESTKGKLELNIDSLNKKLKSVEMVDLEKAITDFIEQDYVYKAALKMGNNILSPSFIDFMR